MRSPARLFGVRFALAIFAVFLGAAAPVCHGQTRVPVYVSAAVNNEDETGSRLLFEIREAAQSSSGYRLVTEWQNRPYLRLYLSTVRTAAGGLAIGYAVVYDGPNTPMDGILISGGVKTCGTTNGLVDCARDLLAVVDAAGQRLQRNEPIMWNTLRVADEKKGRR